LIKLGKNNHRGRTDYQSEQSRYDDLESGFKPKERELAWTKGAAKEDITPAANSIGYANEYVG